MVIQFWGINCNAQGSAKSTIVTSDFMGKNIHGILLRLSKDYDFALDYDKSILSSRPLSRKSFEKTPLSEVLGTLLESSKVNYYFTKNRVLIIREDDIEIETTAEPKNFNFTLQGKILDIENGETLPFATILVQSTGEGTTSNVDGFFTLLNVPSDTSSLVAQYMGYRRQVYYMNPSDLNSSFEIKMVPEVSQLAEVVIAGQKEHMIKASDQISKFSVSPKQLAALPSLGEKDIFRSLQLLPGISATNETSSGLYVRGGTPDQNLVLFDGFTVYHVDHFYGFFSAFNANAIKDVQLYKGGFGSEFGGRISSVVELTGKLGNSIKPSFSAGLSAVSGNASLEIPIAKGKGSFLLAGRRSYTDIIQSGLYDNIFDLFNESDDTSTTPTGGARAGGGRGGGRRGFAQAEKEPAFFFHDLNSKITYRPSDRDIVSLSFYNGKDQLDNSSESNSDLLTGASVNNQFVNSTTDLAKWGNWGSSLKWGRQWNSSLYSNAVVAYSNYFSDRDLFSTSTITREDSTFTINQGTIEDNDLKDYTFRLDNEYLISQSNTLKFGAQLTYNKIDYQFILNDTISVLDRNDQGLTSSLYVTDKWSLTDRLTIQSGVRLSNYSVTGKNYLEPRVSGYYKLTDKIKLKGAWGKYNQFVNRIIREDISQGSRDFWLLADDKTNFVSSSTHYIAGVSYETNQFLFDVEVYHKNLTGLAEYSLRFSNPRNAEASFDELFFQGTGYSRGAEFLIQKKFGKYTGWVGYTLGQVIYEFPDFADEPFPALHDQTHEFKFVNSFRLGSWTLAGTWVYATGKPYTAPIGGYELNLLDGNSISYVDVGEKNAFRLPNYHRMDISVTRKFPLGSGKGELGLSIFNLYGRSNVWYKTFEILEDDILSTDVNTIGFTPNLFFNISF